MPAPASLPCPPRWPNWARTAAPVPLANAVAVDGKALRGSRTAPTTHVTLSALDPTAHVLAQRQVTDKSNEFPVFRLLLNSVDLTGTVITADAPHTQHAHGTYLRECGAHCIAQTRANHPGLFDRVRCLLRRKITLDHHDRTRAHHRLEIRRLRTAAFTHLDYPDARQTLYVVHWKIENLLHHVRSRTFRENDSKIYVGHLPRVMAGPRNLAIGVHRQDGHTNIAAALRRTARD